MLTTILARNCTTLPGWLSLSLSLTVLWAGPLPDDIVPSLDQPSRLCCNVRSQDALNQQKYPPASSIVVIFHPSLYHTESLSGTEYEGEGGEPDQTDPGPGEVKVRVQSERDNHRRKVREERSCILSQHTLSYQGVVWTNNVQHSQLLHIPEQSQ